MNSNVSPIVDNLKKELDALDKKRIEILKQAEQFEREMGRIEGAIRALLGQAPAPVARAKSVERPTLNRDEIIDLSRKALEKGGPMHEKDLRSVLGEEAARAGRSRKGLHLVLPKILKAGPFRPVNGKWAVVGRG